MLSGGIHFEHDLATLQRGRVRGVAADMGGSRLTSTWIWVRYESSMVGS